MNRSITRRGFITSAAVSGIALVNSGAAAMQALKRPFGPKLKTSCAAYSYRKYLREDKSMNMFDFLDECAKMGCDAAEPTSYFFPEELNEDYWTRFRHKAFMLGLDISGTAIGNTFTHPAGAKREEQLAHTRTWIDHAASMGAPVIRIFAGNVQSGQSREDAIRNTVETTQIALEYAAEKGVFLALENHGGIVARPDEMLEIVNQIDSPWFGVNFDSGNFHGRNPYADLEQIAPYAINAQVKVEIRPEGQDKMPADFDRIISILVENDYRGYVALEYEGGEEPKEAIPRHMEELMNAIERA